MACLASADKQPQFHLRFRRRSPKADHERLVRLMLGGSGNVEDGRKVFYRADKSQCSKCHRMGAEGGQIGPDLSEVGSRFSKIHLIEAVLNPSLSIAPGYETLSMILRDGRVLTGVRASETDGRITLGDNEGKTHLLSRSDVEEVRTSPISIMPEGLEKQLTNQELIDLIAFLMAQVRS
jgi:putative heme-binding domain-containing protein